MVARAACETVGVDRRARLRDARLYFVADRGGMARALEGALAGGADLFQLRDKDATDDELLAAAATRARALPRRRRALRAQRPPRPRGRLRRRRRARRPGRHARRPRAQARRRRRDRRALDALDAAGPGRRPQRRRLHRRRARCTPRRPRRAARRSASSRSSYAAAHVDGPVVRHRRHRRRHGRRGGQGGRAADRRRARASPRPTTPRRRRARCAPRRTGRGVGRRSRKRRPGAGRRSRPRRPRPAGGSHAPRLRARRGAQRRGARRSSSRSAPGERPRAARDRGRRRRAAGVANLVAWLAGLDVEGEEPGAFGVLALLRGHVRSPPGGLWQRRYWAVLGFEALLGDHVVFFVAVAARRLQRARRRGLCVPIICGAGWLFWKLIRVMGRLQAPQRVR